MVLVEAAVGGGGSALCDEPKQRLRRRLVRSAILEYSDNIYLNRCKFRFLELYFYHSESREDWEES